MLETSSAKENVNRRIMIDLQRRLALIEDDIKVAKKTRENLRNDNEKIEEQIDQNLFRLEELKSQKPEVNAVSNPEEITEEEKKTTFFGNLAQLEAFEANTSAQIEELKKQYSQCTHEYTIQIQRQKVLESKLLNAQERLNLQKEQHNNAKSEYAVTQQENLRLSDQAYNLNDTLSYLKEVLENKQTELDSYSSQLDDHLSGQKKPLLEEREELLKDLEFIQGRLKKLQEQHEKNVVIQENEVKQADNINTWIFRRKQLLEQIKKKRTNMSRNQTSLKRAQLMNTEIRSKFTAMFGRSDPGDGTGAFSKLMVQSEIDSIEESNKVYIEINAEENYNQQLKKDLQQIENSLKEFDKFSQNTLSELGCEIEACKNEAYLNLLKDEKTAIITSNCLNF